MWPFNKKHVDLDAWTATNCARCGNPLGAEFFTHPDRLNDPFLKDVRYCSKACIDKVVIPKPIPVYRAPPEPIHLVTSELLLLTGKSSGGMYFDAGRCSILGEFQAPLLAQKRLGFSSDESH
jgi:hypothetical protein